jgi:mRNA interferase HigB
MKVMRKGILDEFCKIHTEIASQILIWLSEAEGSEWKTPQDIKARYASASFLENNRVIFNLKGNKYRLDTKIAYKTGIVLIMRIGTHAEYSKWVQY